MSTYGEVAYEAYRECSGGKSLVSGHPIPGWTALHDDIKQAWEAAAKAVVGEILTPPTNLGPVPSESSDPVKDHMDNITGEVSEEQGGASRDVQLFPPTGGGSAKDDLAESVNGCHVGFVSADNDDLDDTQQ